MISSVTPSAKYSWSGSPDILVKGSTAMDGLSGSSSAGCPGSLPVQNFLIATSVSDSGTCSPGLSHAINAFTGRSNPFSICFPKTLKINRKPRWHRLGYRPLNYYPVGCSQLFQPLCEYNPCTCYRVIGNYHFTHTDTHPKRGLNVVAQGLVMSLVICLKCE